MFSLGAPANALQLLAQAGGALAGGDPARAFIMRGKARVPVNLEPRSPASPAGGVYPMLEAGDVLVVPFRDVTRRVLVAGEVQAPRPLEYVEGMTVLDAFVEAGGATDFSDLDGVFVERRGSDGKHEQLRVDLDRILKRGDLSGNIPVLPGDIVVVPR
jgi:protein involved in polysaccharide export with SLBB domain